jgi:hypothetical protein
MPSLTIARHPEPPAGWEQLAREQGTFYHHPLWITEVARCYAYRLHVLIAETAGQVVGGLALAEVPALVGRRRLVSFPFSFVAGPVAATHDARDALALAARDLAVERGISRIELKQSDATPPPAPGFERSERYTTFRVSTLGGAQAVWKRLHVTSTQQRIRKGEKAGVTVSDGTSEEDWLAMARLEELVQHGHGVPAPPRRFFLDSCRRLQRAGLVDLYLARIPDGRIAAGFVMFKGPRDWVYAFSASQPALVREYRPTHVLLWAGLQRAAAAGVTVDLGRTAPEQASLAEFKQRWGAEAVPLAYDYWPSAGGLNQGRRDRGALALAARAWSALPAPVARLGSALYRYLG